MKWILLVARYYVNMYVGGRTFSCPCRAEDFHFAIDDDSAILEISLQETLDVV
jgi:hypothetical protein